MPVLRFTRLFFSIALLSAASVPVRGEEVLVKDMTVDLTDKSAIVLTISRKKLEDAPRVLGEGKQEGASVNVMHIIDSVHAWLKANPKHDAEIPYFGDVFPVTRLFQVPKSESEGREPFGPLPDKRCQLDKYQWKFDQIIGKEIDLGITPGALSWKPRPSGRMYFEAIFWGADSKGSSARLSIFAFQDGSILVPSLVKANEAQLHKADRERRGL